MNEIERFFDIEIQRTADCINDRKIIDSPNAEQAKVQQNKTELSAEPIKVADWLVDRYMGYAEELERHFAAENAGKIVDGSSVDKFRKAQVAKIRQIAEHLMVYCNHAEVG